MRYINLRFTYLLTYLLNFFDWLFTVGQNVGPLSVTAKQYKCKNMPSTQAVFTGVKCAAVNTARQHECL